MNRAVSIALALSLAPLCLSTLRCAPAVQQRESDLEQEWIAKDIARIEQLRAAFADPKLSVDGLKKHLGSCDVREDRSIGFGARRLMIAVYGGYTTAWLHVLATAPDDRGASLVGELLSEQNGSPEHWSEVSARLRTRWGPTVRETERGFRVEYRNPSVSRDLRAQCERELGELGQVDVPDALKSAVETLCSPFEDLILGIQCGDDGGPPPGRPEVLALVEAGRFDLLRVALRGMNPEGRAWAAWALMERAKSGQKLDPLDDAAIGKLRKLPLELTTSQGCTIMHLKFDEALKIVDG